MSRAPFVLPKPDVPFPTEARLWHTQVGWRMVNPRFPAEWTASLGASAEAVARELGIGRDRAGRVGVAIARAGGWRLGRRAA